jgi:hypothetical protein
LQDRPASIWQKSQQKGRRKIKTEHFIEGAFLIPKNEGDLIMKNTLKLTDGQLEKLFDLVSDALDQEDKNLPMIYPAIELPKQLMVSGMILQAWIHLIWRYCLI